MWIIGINLSLLDLAATGHGRKIYGFLVCCYCVEDFKILSFRNNHSNFFVHAFIVVDMSQLSTTAADVFTVSAIACSFTHGAWNP